MSGSFTRLLKIALSYKSWMALAALLGFLTVGSGIGLMMTSAYIIAKAALHPSIAELQVAIVGVRFFGIARGVFRYLERYVSHEVTFRLLARFRVWFYKALEPLAPARLMKYRSGDLLTRIVSDVESLEHIYVRVIAPPVTAIAISVLMWFLFGIFDTLFSALLLFFFQIGGIGVPLLVKALSQKTGKQLITLRSRLNILAVDGVQGMAELLAFGRQNDHLQEFHDLNGRFIVLQRRMALINGLHESLIGLIMNLAVLSMLLTAIPKVNASLLDGIFLSVLVIGTMAAFEAILPLPAAAQYLDNSLKAAERLFQITDAKPEVSDPLLETTRQDSQLPVNDDVDSLVSGVISAQADIQAITIKITNLRFRYQPEEALVFNGLSMEIPEKSFIAVIGPSGSGKSSLINLLMRFWEFRDGEITIGGRDIRQLPQDDVRSQFAVVSQNTHLFNGTVTDNLSLANPSAGEQDIIRSSQQAHIHDFITGLPNGYDTWIGEQGLRFSGGERQRLAIARAILKNSPILIFDEPTANLDVVTEKKILDTIWEMSREKTVLLFTHRLVGLDKADKILVLSGGRIVEQGGHYQLLEKKQRYYQAWISQNQLIIEETSS